MRGVKRYLAAAGLAAAVAAVPVTSYGGILRAPKPRAPSLRP